MRTATRLINLKRLNPGFAWVCGSTVRQLETLSGRDLEARKVLNQGFGMKQ